jgi:hypothetical protein
VGIKTPLQFLLKLKDKRVYRPTSSGKTKKKKKKIKKRRNKRKLKKTKRKTKARMT